MVLTQTRKMTSTPPGGCHSKVMEIVSRNVPVLRQLMMTAAAGQKVPIIQPQVKAFFQRLDMMYLQFQIQTRNTKDFIASLVAHPAEIEVSPDNLISFLLPGISLSESSSFAVPVLRWLRFLGADVSTWVDPAAILT